MGAGTDGSPCVWRNGLATPPRPRYLRTVLEGTAKRMEIHPGKLQRLGHYKILDVLGTGVLTTIYRAEAEGLGRVVALKVLRSSAGRESAFYRRFEREARLLASLHHPNLIALFDFDMGSPGERPPHMVLEHVAGATLAEVL
ncbi:MAG: hypothetical protein NVSMB1_15920 [Polyangiales bacterium]